MASEACPIVSNIQSTNRGDRNHHLIPEQSDFNDEDFGTDDSAFDDESGDPMDLDDGWGSIHESANDQPIINHDDDMQHDAKPKIGINDENPLAEGDEVEIEVENGGKPQIENKKAQKCWVCESCFAVNNLLQTNTIYNFSCAICGHPYPTTAPIIFSQDWDEPNIANNIYQNVEDEIYAVWICVFCTLQNSIDWNKCDGCNQPKGKLAGIAYTCTKPKRLNNYPNNNNAYAQWQAFGPSDNQINAQMNNNKKKNKKQKPPKPRRPRIENIGIARKFEQYPSKLGDIDYEDRLLQIFGRPYQNKLLSKQSKNAWTIDCNLAHSRIEWLSHPNSAISFVFCFLFFRFLLL